MIFNTSAGRVLVDMFLTRDSCVGTGGGVGRGSGCLPSVGTYAPAGGSGAGEEVKRPGRKGDGGRDNPDFDGGGRGQGRRGRGKGVGSNVRSELMLSGRLPLCGPRGSRPMIGFGVTSSKWHPASVIKYAAALCFLQKLFHLSASDGVTSCIVPGGSTPVHRVGLS